jgi:hypothetical protein
MVAFSNTKYESDSGDIHPLRISPTVLGAAGTPPTGAVSNSIKVKVSKTNRSYGIRPRGVRLSRTVGTDPDTFKRYKFIPVLTPTAFNGASFALNGTVSINSVVWTITGKVPEDY